MLFYKKHESIRWFVDQGCTRPWLFDPFSLNLWRNIKDPFYWHGFTLIPIWISNYIHYKGWDENTNPFSNFKCIAVEVWQSNFIMILHRVCDYLSMMGSKLIAVFMISRKWNPLRWGLLKRTASVGNHCCRKCPGATTMMIMVIYYDNQNDITILLLAMMILYICTYMQCHPRLFHLIWS